MKGKIAIEILEKIVVVLMCAIVKGMNDSKKEKEQRGEKNDVL